MEWWTFVASAVLSTRSLRSRVSAYEPIPVGQNARYVETLLQQLERAAGGSQMETKKPRRPWRVSDELWARIEPLLPPGKPHPLGWHNPRVENRRAFDAILFVLRTGCQWNALNATGLCSNSSAHRRFQERVAAGVFSQLWALGLHEYDELKGSEWACSRWMG
jgi:transposase